MKKLLFIFIKFLDKLASFKGRKKGKNEKNNDPPDAIYPLW